MIFKKSLNNNIALAEDPEGNELIVIGTGIGFKKVKGQTLRREEIQKTFRIGADERYQRIEQFFNEIPLPVIDIADQIIQLGHQYIGARINDSILLPLSDHIHYALERLEKKLEIQSPLQWEVRHLYPKEFMAGQKAVALINEAFQVILPESEASFIALHFVNAQIEHGTMNQTLKITTMINQILHLMTEHFNMKLEQDSMNYSRFITHLRYFIVRQMNKVTLSFKDEHFLYDVLSERYPDSYECVRKIKQFVEQEYGFHINKDEMVYLIIHVERMTSRSGAE
ncbi:PRD domain-containing protein [Paenibacillus sp. FSL K6-1096]|uniref:BglG family transcription antiterminator LicT n=1 Tax=Paenibacillus sp. FSL K6-1096 TaxID=2921460 RepID=UPI0030EBDA94